MATITKIVHQQDAYFKIGPRKSGETSINLSVEITNLIGRESGQVSFVLHKEDLLKALCTICSMLPLYKSTSQKADEVAFSVDVFNKLHNDVVSFFGNNEEREYKVNLFVRTDGRSYLNELKYEGLNVRNFLVENHSKMIFTNENGRIDLRLETSVSVINEDNEVQSQNESHNILETPIANYITQHDNEKPTKEELQEICNKMYSEAKEAKEDIATLALHLFGILYAPFFRQSKTICT